MRTRFPDGTPAIKLEPFTDAQIENWLNNWASVNTKFFNDSGLRPLDSATAIAQGELARQPLLLLMLALYDAEANMLQLRAGRIGSTDLYLDLLSRFARREVVGRDLQTNRREEHDIKDESERQLRRLSIVALGMFTRGRQYARIDEIAADFGSIFPPPGSLDSGSSLAEPQTEAHSILGRFFFIYESRRQGERELRTYEFLHPTFSEFLVARYILQAIDDYCRHWELARSGHSLANFRSDDGLLFAMLSFQLITSRTTVTRFLSDLASGLPSERRAAIVESLIDILRFALRTRPDRGFAGFCPLNLDFTERVACYSANLTVIALIVAPNRITTETLSVSQDFEAGWHRYASLWQSQLLHKPGWTFLAQSISIERTPQGVPKKLEWDPEARRRLPETHWWWEPYTGSW
jgi:hypothetical protein